MLPALLVLAVTSPPNAKNEPPIRLHPDNPHYFLFRGKPTVLITSGEHYGAVLNLDFDYVTYLDELKARGLNLTRLFSGTYREVPESFHIARNTLAPAPGRYVAPWARSATPGAADGGNRFDLQKWDDAYFRRLKDFLRQASRRGIVVEYVLFCPFYEQVLWNINPMKAGNNVNGVGNVPREEVYTLRHADLVAVHEAVTRKAVRELNEFDNLYFEICNEPYFGGVTLEWQHRIADVIVKTEADLPQKHLIAQNIANGSARVEKPHPAVSIFNFHYANPPDAVTVNYGLQKVIAFDETGFKGTDDTVYRTDAWEFLLAGGAVYSHLDYSFAVGHEKGDFAYPSTQPGGGSAALREHLRILKEFIESFDFIRMAPNNGILKGGVPEGAAARALAEVGRAYALYLKGGSQANLTLDIPAGRYRAEWVNTRTGAVDKRGDVDHQGGGLTLSSPSYTEDIALRIVRRDNRRAR